LGEARAQHGGGDEGCKHEEEGQGHKIAVGGGDTHGAHGGEVGRDDIGVGEDGAARHHVHRRRGDGGERVTGGHGGGRGLRSAIERIEGLEALAPRAPEEVPVGHLRLARGPPDHPGEGSRVGHHHPGRGAIDHPRHLLRGEPPVDGIGEDAQARAGSIEHEVRGFVLREHADAIALADSEGGQSPASSSTRRLKSWKDSRFALDDGPAPPVQREAPRAIMS
jgi:hypothetical protein